MSAARERASVAHALRLCQLGMDVTGIGRREDPLKDVEKTASSMPGSFRWKSVNVRESEKLVAKIAEAGEAHGIDLLVNNAGGQFFAPATNISKGGWEAVIDLNLTAVFAATKAAYPFLKERQGAVVNMSLSGVERGSMGLAHSVAARAGVLGMTRSLALEWAGDGIRLNCIGPGTVVTAGLSDEAAREMLIRCWRRHRCIWTRKLRRWSNYRVFASPAGRMMTGQLIQIDGGAHIGAAHMIEAD